MDLRQLTNRKYVKGSLTVLGAIIVGAVGSGVWENLLKPAFASSRDVILNVVSFGIESYKDATYVEIAKGFHEGVSLVLLVRFSLLLITFLTILIFCVLYVLSKDKSEWKELIDRIDRSIQESEGTGKKEAKQETPEDIKKRLVEIRQSQVELRRRALEGASLRGFKIATYVLVVWTIFVLSFVSVETIKIIYINSAITHFQQVSAIASPFMDEKKKSEVLAYFARIRRRSDYVSIVNDLKTVAEGNGQIVPEFSIW